MVWISDHGPVTVVAEAVEETKDHPEVYPMDFFRISMYIMIILGFNLYLDVIEMETAGCL